MLHEIDEVGLEELGAHLVSGKLLEQLEQDIQPYLGHIAHGVLEGPHYGVHQELELRWRDLHQSYMDTHMLKNHTIALSNTYTCVHACTVSIMSAHCKHLFCHSHNLCTCVSVQYFTRT